MEMENIEMIYLAWQKHARELFFYEEVFLSQDNYSLK